MTALPTELGIVFCLALMAASLWIPFIVGVTTDPADPDNFTRPGDLKQLRPWVHRAHRAHLNLLEQFLPFAVLVFLVDRLDAYSALTYWTAIAFFWLRVAHAVGMITGVAKMPLRPILFSAGWACCLLMGYAVLTA
jgi:uncharacterized MAPEG superfamily protein